MFMRDISNYDISNYSMVSQANPTAGLLLSMCSALFLWNGRVWVVQMKQFLVRFTPRYTNGRAFYQLYSR